jgi:hypothetical protein
MVQKPSLEKQLSPLRFLDNFLPLRRSSSSSLLLELEVEYAELESPLFLDCRSSLCLPLCLCLWSRLQRYLPFVFDLCL